MYLSDAIRHVIAASRDAGITYPTVLELMLMARRLGPASIAAIDDRTVRTAFEHVCAATSADLANTLVVLGYC